MNVELLRYPTSADWKRCLTLAKATQGRATFAEEEPSDEWKRRILRAGHSPIRTLPFTVLNQDIPYYSAMHFVRHKVGCEWYVSSQRGTDQRWERKQGEPVSVILDCNAQALMNILAMRLCEKADTITMNCAIEIRSKVLARCPEFETLLVPRCGGNKGLCPEMIPCWREQ